MKRTIVLALAILMLAVSPALSAPRGYAPRYRRLVTTPPGLLRFYAPTERNLITTPPRDR